MIFKTQNQKWKSRFLGILCVFAPGLLAAESPAPDKKSTVKEIKEQCLAAGKQGPDLVQCIKEKMK